MRWRGIVPFIVAVGVSGVIVDCGSDSSDGGSAPSTTTTQYEGLIASRDGAAGVMTLSLQTIATKTLRPRGTKLSLSGSITLAPFGTVTVSGTYDDDTKKFEGTAGPITLSGTVSADSITVDWTAGGASGRAELTAASLGEGAYFCGSYAGTASGGFHALTRGSKAYALITNGTDVKLVDGTRASAHVKVAFPPSGSAEGDVAGTTFAGSWTDGAAASGTFSATRDACGTSVSPDGGTDASIDGTTSDGTTSDGTTSDGTTEAATDDSGETGTMLGIRTLGRGVNTTHVCVSTGTDTSVYCWGTMVSGLFGDKPYGSSADQARTTPVQVKGPGGTGTLTGVTSLATSDTHTCAVVGATGEVYCWGVNTYGAIGDGTKSNATYPTKVKGVSGVGFLTGATRVVVTKDVSCALAGTKVYCWGDNGSALLGTPSMVPADSSTPIEIGGLTSAKALTMGESTACVVRATDGAILCWGFSRFGAGFVAPTAVPGSGGTGTFTGATDVSMGFEHGCAVKSDGTVWCFGNLSGAVAPVEALGGNGASGLNYPVQVKGVGGAGLLSPIDGVSVGLKHSCAYHGGDVWCWGANDRGQLGDGTKTTSATPVKLSGITDGNGLYAVFNNTFVRRIDGTLWATGSNQDRMVSPSGGDRTAAEKNTLIPY